MKFYFQGHEYIFKNSSCNVFTAENSKYIRIRFKEDQDLSNINKALEVKFLGKSTSDGDLGVTVEDDGIYVKGTLCQILRPLDLPEIVIKAKLISTRTQFEIFD